MDRLKPCPFCGGEAMIKRKNECIGFGDCDTYFFVECKCCGASTKWIGRLDVSDKDRRPILAADMWNRRAEDGK